MLTSKQELVADLRSMNVESRHVMIHSSYKAIRPVEGGPAGVVDAFVEAVGDGVLLFPTYDFTAWTEQGYWDRERSPSRMGVISETARTHEKAMRTSHPMLSYAVLHDGHQNGLRMFREGQRSLPSDFYTRDDWNYGYMPIVNAHGAGSVFARFVENDGLLLSIGADQQEGFKPDDTGFTAPVHAFVEAGVDWRVMKVFEGVYVDGGVASIRKYAASVTRDPKRHQTAVTPGHLEGERLGVIKRMKLGRTVCWVAEARAFHEFAVESCVKRPELWRKEL